MQENKSNGLKVFWSLTALMVVFRIVLGFLMLPKEVAFVFDIAVTLIFVVTPIVALYFASKMNWTPKAGTLLIVAGATLHIIGAVLLLRVLAPTGFLTVIVQALVQGGIALWTLGLGVLVATAVKDKNLILPVALFLAGLDMFLVFNPDAPTAKIVKQNPQVFQSMAYSVPGVRTNAPAQNQGVQVVPKAFVGPADLLFIATFFVLLTRYKMRIRETVRWMAPVMAIYLLLVLSPFGLGMLPALVPIGATVLIVNRHEFNLSGEEKVMTWFAFALALSLAGFALFRHFTSKTTAAPTGPSRSVDVRGLPGSGQTQEPTSQGQSQ